MKLLGVRRKIVETWLYIEVALMFGSGILGLGHHYFWIGIPDTGWLSAVSSRPLSPFRWLPWWFMRFMIPAHMRLKTVITRH